MFFWVFIFFDRVCFWVILNEKLWGIVINLVIIMLIFFEDVKNKMIVIKVKIEEVVEREYDVCLELKIKV